MKTFKQILVFLLAIGIGIVIGNVVNIELDLDSLASLYNLTDYIDVIYDYFTE